MGNIVQIFYRRADFTERGRLFRRGRADLGNERSDVLHLLHNILHGMSRSTGVLVA